MQLQDSTIDVVLVVGTFDYGTSVSGNYIIYKTLKKVPGLKIKVLPLFPKTIHTVIDRDDLLEYSHNSQELLSRIPPHKILYLTGDDFPPQLIKSICRIHNSKLVVVAMTNWLYSNTYGTAHPELTTDMVDMFGDLVDERLAVFTELDAHVVCASSYTAHIHSISKLSIIQKVIIPLPFEEIDVDRSFYKEPNRSRKIILWGTTQPYTYRKGKVYFENILEHLYRLVSNPGDILIQTIGPPSEIKTEFEVEYLGSFTDRMQLSRIYQNADVFALTTLADAGPMMATECIRNNTPLVAFSTNVAMDFVSNGKNGYITNATDEYAQKLYNILFNQDFHMDFDYVKAFNSEAVVCAQYQDFFRRILNP